MSEALPIVFDLLKHEGLCLGGSTGINIAGAIRLAKELGPGHTIVTILCDYRHPLSEQAVQPGHSCARRTCRRRTGCKQRRYAAILLYGYKQRLDPRRTGGNDPLN